MDLIVSRIPNKFVRLSDPALGSAPLLGDKELQGYSEELVNEIGRAHV